MSKNQTETPGIKALPPSAAMFNKALVLTAPVLSNFGILARVRHITAYANCVLNTPGEITMLSP